jgi:hypothetical protein
MTRLRIALGITVLVLLAAVAAAVAQNPPPPAPAPAVNPHTGQTELPCTGPDGRPAGLPKYDLGPEFEGLPASHAYRRCDPQGRPSGRANFHATIYGDCVIEAGQQACAPPLEVQTFPACERPGDYRFGPGNAPMPREETRIAGRDAAIFAEGGRVEVYTKTATVVLFGDDLAQLRRAAAQIRPSGASEPNPFPCQAP